MMICRRWTTTICGAALKKHCEAKLTEAQARIDKITKSAGGIAAEPADLE